ncbi:MAG: TrmH family RNA methyltransferase [Bdellovibrionales bacterium]
MKTVTSFSNPIVKAVKALHDRKERTKTKSFLVEGLQAIGMAFEAGVLPDMVLYAAEKTPHALLKKILNKMDGRNVVETTFAILGKISSRDNPQTVLAVYGQRWLKLSDVKAKGVWVVLDNIKDPGNLGTIMRTCDAVGASGIILVGDTCDPYSTEAVRATMGSVFAVPLVKCSADEFLKWQKGWKGETVATTLQGSVDYRKPKYKAPLLLMMGNEQKGLPDSFVNAASHKVKLPMRGTAESLNVAVATAIMLYQLYEAMGE